MSFVPAGAMAGMGLSELAGGAIGALDLPRQALWNAILGTSSGTELMSRMGMDPDSPWTQALGMGSEMLFDPLNLIGAGVGAKAGKVVGNTADIVAARKSLSAERKALEDAYNLSQINKQTAKTGGMVPVSQAGSTYHPAIMKELEHGSLAQGRTYNRVNPEMAHQVQEMGIGNMIPGGGMHFPHGKPSFMAGKGGVLGQSQPMPWRANFDTQMVDQLGNNMRLPDQMNDLIEATFRPQAMPSGTPGLLDPERLAEIRRIEQSLGEPGTLELLLSGPGNWGRMF